MLGLEVLFHLFDARLHHGFLRLDRELCGRRLHLVLRLNDVGRLHCAVLHLLAAGVRHIVLIVFFNLVVARLRIRLHPCGRACGRRARARRVRQVCADHLHVSGDLLCLVHDVVHRDRRLQTLRRLQVLSAAPASVKLGLERLLRIHLGLRLRGGCRCRVRRCAPQVRLRRLRCLRRRRRRHRGRCLLWPRRLRSLHLDLLPRRQHRRNDDLRLRMHMGRRRGWPLGDRAHLFLRQLRRRRGRHVGGLVGLQVWRLGDGLGVQVRLAGHQHFRRSLLEPVAQLLDGLLKLRCTRQAVFLLLFEVERV
mmetsp:Transcript_45183/g.131468  ORF Transcript_45183/g.131468 Transcript_45183/m.131468 type:complete len:307 (+) Transcript_45183:201-1121(+)